MTDPGPILDRLARSRFRSRFRLRDPEQKYLSEKGLEHVLAHAASFVRTRLAPANPVNDGSQTPMKGHPAFVAQHATATCCRSCLWKWHGMAKEVELTDEQIAQILRVIEAWLRRQPCRPAPASEAPTLFDPP